MKTVMIKLCYSWQIQCALSIFYSLHTQFFILRNLHQIFWKKKFDFVMKINVCHLFKTAIISDKITYFKIIYLKHFMIAYSAKITLVQKHFYSPVHYNGTVILVLQFTCSNLATKKKLICKLKLESSTWCNELLWDMAAAVQVWIRLSCNSVAVSYNSSSQIVILHYTSLPINHKVKRNASFKGNVRFSHYSKLHKNWKLYGLHNWCIENTVVCWINYKFTHTLSAAGALLPQTVWLTSLALGWGASYMEPGCPHYIPLNICNVSWFPLTSQWCSGWKNNPPNCIKVCMQCVNASYSGLAA